MAGSWPIGAGVRGGAKRRAGRRARVLETHFTANQVQGAGEARLTAYYEPTAGAPRAG